MAHLATDDEVERIRALVETIGQVLGDERADPSEAVAALLCVALIVVDRTNGDREALVAQLTRMADREILH